jgi:hypothetical protein
LWQLFLLSKLYSISDDHLQAKKAKEDNCNQYQESPLALLSKFRQVSLEQGD